MENQQQCGKIITFYSYKGGTGRSMALANVAWGLACNGKRVLAIDWDLEAPGLHRYFAPFLVDKELNSSDGLIDFLIAFEDAAVSTFGADPNGESVAPDWFRPWTDFLPFVVSLDWEFPGKGALDLLPAGKQGPAYSHRVSFFKWDRFYNKFGGGSFLDAVREQWRVEYDYILIDSRTGVSDTSGICTVQMPDSLVVCFTLNNQSIDGAAAAASSADEQRRASKLKIFPVQMRVEQFEQRKLDKRRELAREKFGRFLWHLPSGSDPAKFFNDTQFFYKPFYAYEELLAAFGDDPQQTKASLLESAADLTRYLTDGEVAGLPPEAVPAKETREAVLALFEGQTPAVDPALAYIAAASAVLGRLSREDQQVARRVFGRMVRVTRAEEGGDAIPVKYKVGDLDVAAQRIVRTLADAQVLVIETDAENTQTARLAHEGLVKIWQPLRAWLNEDRGFLLWRQQLNGDLTLWQERQNEGALLSGAGLEVAKEWRYKREADLTETEIDYIRRSGDLLDMQRFREHQRLKELEQRKAELQERESEKQHLIAANVKLEGQQKRRGRYVAMGVVLLLLGGLIVGVYIYRQSKVELLTISGIDEAGRDDTNKAIETFNQALRINSQYPEALYNRGLAYLKKNDNLKAEQDFLAAIAAKPDYGEAYLELGSIYLGKGEDQKAEEQFQQALRLNPRLQKASIGLGHIYTDKGDLEKALSYYNEVIPADLSTDKNTPPLAYVGRGSAYLKKGEVESAIKDFNKALDLDPTLFDAYYNRGSAYLQRGRQGDFRSAASDFAKATEFRRDDAGTFLNLAVASQKLGEREKAIANYQRALDVNKGEKNEDAKIADSARQGLQQLQAPMPQQTSPTSEQVRIYLHYLNSDDAKVLNAIADRLRSQTGGNKQIKYRVQGKQLATQATSGDVRYFDTSDKEAAIDVQKIVERVLAEQKVSLKLELRFPTALASPKLKGSMEVWLPSLMPSKASSATSQVLQPDLKSRQQGPEQAPSKSGRDLTRPGKPDYPKP